jgi:adenosylhomocysteinase
MDMSFANQALSAEYMLKNSKKLKNRSIRRSREDRQGDRTAQAERLGVFVDKLTPERKQYLASWEMGT